MDKICKNCTNDKCKYRAEKVAANNCIDPENFKSVGEKTESEKGNCTIPDVSGRSELLMDFLKFHYRENPFRKETTNQKDVADYLKSINSH